MSPEWNLGYALWMIEDGEPDRAVGDIFEWFAVEFWTTKKLAKSAERTISATPTARYRYVVNAQVVFLSSKAAVIDFGLRAIRTRDLLPADCREGDFVTGEIVIGLPLCTEAVPDRVMDSLNYTWRVNRISADLTPYFQQGPRYFLLDESRTEYREVNSTGALKTHSYILHCSRID